MLVVIFWCAQGVVGDGNRNKQEEWKNVVDKKSARGCIPSRGAWEEIRLA